MPIYEFICTKCGHEKEMIAKISDKNPRCEKCNERMTKQMGLTNFQLKGGGWYKDGYSKK